MTVIENIHIIGSSHIAKQSVKEVKDYIENEKPDIVAVELDAARMYALLEEDKGKKRKGGLPNIASIGFAGFMFALIGKWAQKKLGNYVGMSPGSEMKTAIKLAQKNGLGLALIDQDVQVTLRRFSKNFGWKEMKQIFKDMFSRNKMKLDFDLNTVPEEEMIEKMIEEVHKRYPRIYNVLISERNVIMVRNLLNIRTQNPGKRIVAVVGAGHKKEMIQMLAQAEMVRMMSADDKTRMKERLLSRIDKKSLNM